jgi:sortase A
VASRLRWLFLVIGVAALGYPGYVYLDADIYQAYEKWSFDQRATNPPAGDLTQPRAKPPARSPQPREVIGKIEIPRLQLSAMVREGVDDGTLRRAVGHVPGTAIPGDDGNIALAAHRDTFFRCLRDVRKDDRIVVETLGARYEYAVDSLRIVTPKDVSVLQPTKYRALTLVTCYPFYYVGSAPRRFIVRARQVSVEARNGSAPARPGS